MAAAAGSQSRILIGLIAGAAVGSAFNYAVKSGGLDRNVVDWLVTYVSAPVGQIFINLLFLAVVPLVFASLVVGVSRLGGGNLGRIGGITISYFLLTTACAAVIGLTLVNLIRPGDGIRDDKEMQARLMDDYKKEKAVADRPPPKFGVSTFTNIVPANPLKAFVEKDMLALIFTSLLVGVALTRIDPEKARRIAELLDAVNAVTEFIIRVAMAIAPLGVFMLIFSTAARFGPEFLLQLVVFMVTVLAGLAIQLLVVYPLLVRFLGGMNPLVFFRKSRAPMITAFSTCSSAATLPTAIRAAEEELGIPPAVSRFVLPLSTSMNHNGTAMFETVTAIFLCQIFGVDLTLSQQLTILVLCVLTATGVASIPGGSLPLVGLVVESVTPQVPGAAIAMVYGVDRLLDMCRTMTNVTGDMTTVVYVNRLEGALTKPSTPTPEP